MPYPPDSRSADQVLVREINRSLIMNCLREHAPASRARLAEITGLNKSTVSSLIKELIDNQFVSELGLSATHIGRPSTMLELNPRAGFIISVEIGVDFLAAICTDFATNSLWRHRESTRDLKGQDAILNRVLDLLRQAIRAGQTTCENCGRLLGVAVSIPGLVDQVSGELLFAPNLGWRDFPIYTLLREQLSGVCLFVDNEANMAALGEYYFGAAAGSQHVLYLSVGVGLGGGILIDGRLYRGATGFAGEFGHMTMDGDGVECACGSRGCWETQVNQAAVFAAIIRAVQAGRTTRLTALVEGDFDRLTIPLIVAAAQQGDALAQETFSQVGRKLGIGIASLVNALNPDLVLVGGVMSLAGNDFLAAIDEGLRERALHWNAQTTRIALARHGLDASLMGGIARVYQTILAKPSLLYGQPQQSPNGAALRLNYGKEDAPLRQMSS